MRVPGIEQGVRRAAELAGEATRAAWVRRAQIFASAHRVAAAQQSAAVLAAPQGLRSR